MAKKIEKQTQSADSSLFEHDLGYKKWDESFRDLAHDIRRIKTIARNVYIEPKTIYLLFNELIALQSAEDSYLVIDTSLKDVEHNLNKIERALFDKKFLKDFNEDEIPRDAISRSREITKLLLKTFNIFCRNFVECEVRPKPNRKRKALSETEMDNTTKRELKALENIGVL